MDEFDLIASYFKRDTDAKQVTMGVGDDCALLRLPEHSELAFSIDTLLPGVHFFSDSPPRAVAERAFRVAISDLAAMGAEPLCCTLALSLPKVDHLWLDEFSAGLHDSAAAFGCPLVGGDTVRGPLSLSLHMQGFVPYGQALMRKNAQVGDAIYVSGMIGDGAAALEVLSGKVMVENHEAQAYFSDCYYRPQPQLALGQALCGVASAAIDISDGLVGDLGHICRASGVGAALDVAALPMSQQAQSCAGVAQQRQWALYGGDDYQLCFTAPHNKRDEVLAIERRLGVAVTAIGRIIEGKALIDAASGAALALGGYRHFGENTAAEGGVSWD